MKIEVCPGVDIDQDELQWRAARASGPGGQHVNKTSTAVELRFDARRSGSLPDDVSARLQRLAGTKLTLDGVIVIFAQTHRSQEMNRQDALERLLAMLREAAVRPKTRRATKPTYGSKMKRLESKAGRSSVKALRGKPRLD